MIEFEFISAAKEPVPIKIAGIGGAGTSVMDRLVLDGIENVSLIALNTDAQALVSSVAAEKMQLGRQTTRGLGAGGDPEVGFLACEEALEEVSKAFEGAGMVFLCAGLGGGTGSGAAPLIAKIAREQGALVIAFATIPFTFEGKRRRQQADEALLSLQEHADVVICFENEKMGDSVSPKAGIHQAFASADQTVSESIRAICNLFNRPGLIRIGFDELCTVLRSQSASCLFGYGEAEGDNRAHDCLARALKNPLMDRGRMLGDAQSILVNVAGSSKMTLNEVNILMTELNRHVGDHTHILFGAAIDPKMGNRMSVTLVSAIGAPQPQWVRPRSASSRVSAPVDRATPPAPQPVPRPAAEPEQAFEAIAQVPEPEEAMEEPETLSAELADPSPLEADQAPWEEPAQGFSAEEPEDVATDFFTDLEQPIEQSAPEEAQIQPEPEPVAVAPRAPSRPARLGPAPTVRTRSSNPGVPGELPMSIPTNPAPQKQAEVKQETLQFEPVTRGRFEKSEPTIVDGQDLDVPTFLRRNIRIK